MDRRKCVVKGCETRQVAGKQTIGHQFPKLKGHGMLWIEMTGNEDLKKLSFNEITSQRLLICTKHFESKCFHYTQYGARRLAKNALPTLYLPTKLEKDEPSKIDLASVENSPSTSKVNILQTSESLSVGKLTTERNLHSSPGIRESSLNLSTLKLFLKLRKSRRKLDMNMEEHVAKPHDRPLERMIAVNDPKNAVHIVPTKVVNITNPELLTEINQQKTFKGVLIKEELQLEEEEVMKEGQIEGDIHQKKQQKEEAEGKESKTKGRVAADERNVIPKISKIPDYHRLRVGPNNRSVFHIREMTTPLEKRLYCQLQETREENAKLKKKVSRYFKLMQHCGLATVKKVRRVEGFKSSE